MHNGHFGEPYPARELACIQVERSPFPQACGRRLRHPVPAVRSRRPRGPGNGQARRRHQLATGLMRDAVRVDTVEHLLAALVSLGIDNVIVELNSPEVPIMDGSAAPFIYLIQEAGVKQLEAPRRT